MTKDVESVQSLRELFKASALMTGICSFATAGISANVQDPQILLSTTALTGAGLAFGLIQMARTAYHLKKQGEAIFKSNSPS